VPEDGAEMVADDFGEEESSLSETVEFRLRPNYAGRRLDSFLAARFPDRSRTFFQQLIKSGAVRVNGRAVKPSYDLNADDQLRVELPPLERHEIKPQNLPLAIIYEDDYFVVINKAAGMIVHPARGNWDGTLVNALVYHFQQLSGINGPERPGIVHRLDRDTTGLILVAKNDLAHAQVARQWENRRVRKEYLAIVEGAPALDADMIDKPIGRHPVVREKMTIGGLNAREAVTTYEIVERFHGYALVRAKPHTGRTHQIRVHLASVGLRIVADAMYTSRARFTLGDVTRRPEDAERVLLERQGLHAFRLSLWHPITGRKMDFEAPLPDDMTRTLEALRQYAPPK
jgi:23S rRNA pseudouridine1911/1915/1917 synthase